jgi:hypothetical protein
MDLEVSGKRGRICGLRARNKRGIFVLGKMNLLGLFGTFSSFQPSLREIHENLGLYLILYATNKTFPEECI